MGRSIVEAVRPFQPHPLVTRAQGNAIGLALEEQPLITADSADTFEAGGVYSLRVGLRDEHDNAIVSAVVAVNDFGSIEVARRSVPYFVMEHLEGEGLAEVLHREGRIPPRRAAGIVQQCVSGLAAAHAAGVIHRDLKPDNVFLTRVGEREFVKLLDFGVAKMAGAGRLTQAGTALQPRSK